VIARDVSRITAAALLGYRLRAALTLLAMAIGVAAVVVLTALGESARRYVVGEFAALGTNLVIVLPGRSETTGGAPPLLGATPRDLTIEDALALERSRAVRRIAPLALGVAPASWSNREREVTVIGSTAAFKPIRHLEMARGQFLPEMDPHQQAPVCVIGSTLREELFGHAATLGEWVRIGDYRCRVIGELAPMGQSLGTDLGDLVIVPVASALALFDSSSLFRILVEASSREEIPAAERAIRETIRARHEGEDDVTVITQDAVLSTFDRLLRTLTFAVGGIAAISLGVAGVLVMNVMLVSVAERTAEVGLLKALGATRRQIVVLFLTEAAALALLGGIVGLAGGFAGSFAAARLYPILDVTPPAWAAAAAVGTALATGLVFGVMPARRAALLDPVRSLSRR
jgi:putative ABC transport system permease protein